MFSSRTQWNLTPNRLSAHLHTQRRAGLSILDLTESNPTHCGFDYATDEIFTALAHPQNLTYEPHPQGLLYARQAVAAYYADKGILIDPEQIILTATTSEAYSFLFRLLADPDDSLLIPRPSYPLFEFLATLNDVRLVPYPLIYDGSWRIDLDTLSARITPQTRAILVVNPNNPTGSFLKENELSFLLQICQRYGIALISDEVFADYAFYHDPERRSTVSRQRSASSEQVTSLSGIDGVLTFTLSGLSKVAGLPQMKLAWICASGPVDLLREALSRLEVIADTHLSVNAPVQHGLPYLLGYRQQIQSQIHSRLLQNLQFLLDRLLSEETPCTLLDLEGGWYGILRVPQTCSDEEWALRLLDNDGVLVHPGYLFDFNREGYLVVGLLPSPEIFHQGIERVLRRVTAL